MVNEESSTITIGELAKRSGNAASAIRFYESLGLLTSNRSRGGQRRYGPDAIRALRYIAFAQASGFTLSEISALSEAFKTGEPLFGHWRNLAERKLAELDEVVRRAEEMKTHLRQALDCKCVDTGKCCLLTGEDC